MNPGSLFNLIECCIEENEIYWCELKIGVKIVKSREKIMSLFGGSKILGKFVNSVKINWFKYLRNSEVIVKFSKTCSNLQYQQWKFCPKIKLIFWANNFLAQKLLTFDLKHLFFKLIPFKHLYDFLTKVIFLLINYTILKMFTHHLNGFW